MGGILKLFQFTSKQLSIFYESLRRSAAAVQIKWDFYFRHTTHPTDRQVVLKSTLNFLMVLTRVWHPEEGTSLNEIFPVALFEKS